MSNLIFDAYYKRIGVKTPQHLLAPQLVMIDKFSFPRNSVYHHVVYDSVSIGPASDGYFYRDVQKKIFVDHIVDLTEFKGSPKKLSIPLAPYIREFHIKNKRFRFSEDASVTTKDENTLVILNYGLVSKSYRYVRSFYTEYFKWWNIEKTLWDTIKQKAKNSQRQHFVFIDLPKNLPAVSRLDNTANNFNQTALKNFSTPESLFILEFWKWVSAEHRQESVIGEIDKETLRKINIVIKDSGKFILLNLGIFDSWRYIKDISDTNQQVKITPDQLQKRFLRMLMSLMEERSITEPEVSEDDNNEEILEDNKTSDLVEDKGHPLQDVDDENIEDDLSKVSKADKVLKDLDSDLDQLELLDKERAIDDDDGASDSGVTTQFKDKRIDTKFFNVELTPEEAIIQLCDDLADDGILSASEFRKYTNQASSYKTIPSPYDETPIGEFVKIEPSQLTITQSKNIPDIATVLDKTMLKSSLLDFDERYIKDILNKDIVGMTVNAQKAGFVITRYEVEKVQDILGSYEIHTVRVNPVVGTPSTLRFKIPTISEEGVFVANGVKYRLRKQRGDLPIRKTTPDRVALTSYYGKTFVSRSDKKVNDYSDWLRQQIMKKGIDASDDSVLNISPADVFDNSISAPRAYSSIAMGIKSFTSRGYNFVFDYSQRENVFSPEQIQKYEINGSILIGFNATENVLFMDKNGSIYEAGVNTEPTPLGTIENIIGISTLESPIDFAQVKIYGKNIPLALVFGYKYGLNDLLTALKASSRRVAAGQRLNLQEHEYAIAFSDETLILSKDDQLATMIFAGLREYQRSLKNYSIHTFDKPNVYLNVLETNGISARYLREIDLMDNLFIDPITKDLLIEMKEPTSFRGLLIRSAEMLLTDSHPDALDMSYMRIKGYERIAGAIYAEMVNSIREHKSKSSRAAAPIELNPHAVWMRISQDPAKNLVSDINPIENLKQQEAITYSGTGGRIGRSMTKKSRSYHRNDMGIISEATSDSSDVAINTYSSADPQFKSLRGTSKPYVIGKTGPTALLSTSAMMSVGSDQDD